MSQKAAKFCSEADLSRFATCFMNMADKSSVDWDKAAAQYDPAIQVASFKTVTLRALKKLAEKMKAGGEASGDEDEGPKTPNAKAKPGKKRKADDDGDDEEAAKPKGKGGRKPGKKAKKDEDAEAEAGGDGEDEAAAKPKGKGGKKGAKKAKKDDDVEVHADGEADAGADADGMKAEADEDEA